MKRTLANMVAFLEEEGWPLLDDLALALVQSVSLALEQGREVSAKHTRKIRAFYHDTRRKT